MTNGSAAFTAYKPELSKSDKAKERKLLKKISKSNRKESNFSDIRDSASLYFAQSEDKV